MKKLLLVLVLVTMSFVSNAQLFVSGSLAAEYSSGKTKYYNSYVTNDLSEAGFAISPAVGYMIPGKSYGFGLSLAYAYTSAKDHSKGISTNAFDFAPFFRYAYAKFDKITLYADLKMPVGFYKSMDNYDHISIKSGNGFVIGVRLVPGLTYKFNDHILFTTEIGLLSIGYLHTRNTISDNEVGIYDDFVLGANNKTIASFGFVYLF